MSELLNVIRAAASPSGITARHSASGSASLEDEYQVAFAEGYAEGCARIKAVLGAPQIKGDLKRMTAAVDLLKSSPNMGAEAVIDFIAGNISSQANVVDYATHRLMAANSPKPKAGQTGNPIVASAVSEANASRTRTPARADMSDRSTSRAGIVKAAVDKVNRNREP